jgi:low affinity Fe/Cu permease
MGKTRGRRSLGHAMEGFSEAVSRSSGSTWAFVFALVLVLGWLVTGPLFGYSDTWQLVINTTTTILTFLMVFLIQRAQNKESEAASLKLNELIAAMEGASNRLIDVESLSEAELHVLRRHYQHLVRMALRDASLLESHTVEEAESRHRKKNPTRKA